MAQLEDCHLHVCAFHPGDVARLHNIWGYLSDCRNSQRLSPDGIISGSRIRICIYQRAGLQQAGRRTTASRTEDYGKQDGELRQAGRRTTAREAKNYSKRGEELQQAGRRTTFIPVTGCGRHLPRGAMLLFSASCSTFC